MNKLHAPTNINSLLPHDCNIRGKQVENATNLSQQLWIEKSEGAINIFLALPVSFVNVILQLRSVSLHSPGHSQ